MFNQSAVGLHAHITITGNTDPSSQNMTQPSVSSSHSEMDSHTYTSTTAAAADISPLSDSSLARSSDNSQSRLAASSTSSAIYKAVITDDTVQTTNNFGENFNKSYYNYTSSSIHNAVTDNVVSSAEHSKFGYNYLTSEANGSVKESGIVSDFTSSVSPVLTDARSGDSVHHSTPSDVARYRGSSMAASDIMSWDGSNTNRFTEIKSPFSSLSSAADVLPTRHDREVLPGRSYNDNHANAGDNLFPTYNTSGDDSYASSNVTNHSNSSSDNEMATILSSYLDYYDIKNISFIERLPSALFPGNTNYTLCDWNLTLCYNLTNNTTSEPPHTQLAATGQQHWWKLFLLIFPMFTVFGNILVVLSVYKEKSLRTVTNYFIVSLAVADIMVAVFVMPLAVYVEVGPYSYFQLGLYRKQKIKKGVFLK